MVYQNFIKRIIDLVGATLLFVACAPLLLCVAILLKVFQGPVFFLQVRPGLYGRPFKLIKFKSMTDQTDDEGNLLSDDMRLTKIGRLVRAASLDELLQLINVIKGEMSLVGPRPLLKEYLPLYSDYQMQRHDVLPGITGLAQIKGRNLLSWPRRFRYDVFYSKRVGLLLDCWILMQTLRTVIARVGVSAEQSVTCPKFEGNSIGRKLREDSVFRHSNV